MGQYSPQRVQDSELRTQPPQIDGFQPSLIY
jgi:hypothetical protein